MSKMKCTFYQPTTDYFMRFVEYGAKFFRHLATVFPEISLPSGSQRFAEKGILFVLIFVSEYFYLLEELFCVFAILNLPKYLECEGLVIQRKSLGTKIGATVVVEDNIEDVLAEMESIGSLKCDFYVNDTFFSRPLSLLVFTVPSLRTLCTISNTKTIDITF